MMGSLSFSIIEFFLKCPLFIFCKRIFRIQWYSLIIGQPLLVQPII